MSKSKLNERQKDRALELLDAGKTQSSVARFFDVSPRTIHRVRIERGYATCPQAKQTKQPSMNPEAKKALRLLQSLDSQQFLLVWKLAHLDRDQKSEGQMTQQKLL